MQKATMKCTELKFTDTEEKTYLDMLYFADEYIKDSSFFCFELWAGGIPNEAGEFIYTDRQLTLLIEKFTAIANHEGAPGEFKRLTADIRKATHHTFNTSLVKFCQDVEPALVCLRA